MSQVTVSRQALSSAVSACSKIIPSRTTRDILMRVRICADDGKLRVSGSDGEIFMQVDVPCETDGNLDVLVEPSLLSGLLVGSGDAKISVSDSDKLIVDCDGLAEIATEDAANYPPLPEPKGKAWLRCDAEQLGETLSKFRNSVDTEGSKYAALSGMLLTQVDESLVVMASDSRHVVIQTMPAEIETAMPAEDTQIVVIPTKAAVAAATMPDSSVTIEYSGNAIFFTCDTWRLSSKLIDGKYPRISKSIPTEWTLSTNILTSTLASHIKRAAMFGTVEDTSVTLEFGYGNLKISSAKARGGYNASIPIDYQGDSITMFASPTLILKSLVGCGDNAEMRVIDGDNPLMFVDGNFKSVAMPLSKE